MPQNPNTLPADFFNKPRNNPDTLPADFFDTAVSAGAEANLAGAEGVTNRIGAPSTPPPPQGFGETVMNRLGGMVQGVKQAGKDWWQEASNPLTPGGPLGATANALIGKPVGAMMESLGSSEDLSQGLVRLVGMGPGLDEAITAGMGEGNWPKAAGIMTSDYVIPALAGHIAGRALTMEAAAAGQQGMTVPKLTARNAKIVTRTYPAAVNALKDIEREKLGSVAAAVRNEAVGTETWTLNRIQQNIQQPMQEAVQRLNAAKTMLENEQQLAVIEQRGVNRLRQVQLQQEMKAAELQVEAVAQRDVNAFVQQMGQKLHTDQVAYGTEFAHRDVIADFTKASGDLYADNEKWLVHPLNASTVPLESTMTTKQWSDAIVMFRKQRNIGMGLASLNQMVPVRGATPLRGLKAALADEFAADQGNILLTQTNPGIKTVIDLVQGPDIIEGMQAQRALTTLSQYGWDVSDPMLSTNSLRLIRTAHHVLRETLNESVAGFKVGSNEIRANLAEARLLLKAREKMALVPPAAESLAKVERAGTVVGLLNDPRGFRAYWDAMAQDPLLQSSARREVAESLMGKHSRDFATNYGNLHPEIRDIVFSPEQQQFAQQVAAGNERAVVQGAAKYEQAKVAAIRDAVENSKSIFEKKQAIMRIDAEIQNAEASAKEAVGTAKAQRQTKASILKQRAEQMKIEIQTDFDAKYRTLAAQYDAAENRLNVLRKRRRVAWYGIGALGLWKMRNAMEAITSTLGGPGR